MPVLDYKGLKPDIEHILNRAGTKEKSQSNPQILAAVENLLRYIDDSGLLSPKICYERYKVVSVDHDNVLLENNVSLFIPHRLFKDYQISGITAAVSTIGPDLEKESAKMFAIKEPLKGFLLDSIGSAEIDLLSQKACSIIEAEALSQNISTSSPVGPGMFNIPITEQPKLVELAGADRIGVSILSTCEMIPKKTVSMIIGMGSAMPSWSKEHVCRTCSLSQTCPYNRDKRKQPVN
jgi:hypothetical protein